MSFPPYVWFFALGEFVKKCQERLERLTNRCGTGASRVRPAEKRLATSDANAGQGLARMQETSLCVLQLHNPVETRRMVDVGSAIQDSADNPILRGHLRNGGEQPVDRDAALLGLDLKTGADLDRCFVNWLRWCQSPGRSRRPARGAPPRSAPERRLSGGGPRTPARR